MSRLEDLLEKLPPKRLAQVQTMAEEMILPYRLQQVYEQIQHHFGESDKVLPETDNATLALLTIKNYVETMGGKLRLDIELPTGKHIGFSI